MFSAAWQVGHMFLPGVKEKGSTDTREGSWGPNTRTSGANQLHKSGL